MMKEKACDRHGKDGCDMDGSGTDAALGARDFGSGPEADCYLRARLVKLQLREG